MYLTTWRRPLGSGNELTSLRRLNRMLDDVFSGWPMGEESGTITSAWTPAVDVFEDAEGVKIVMEVPGVKPEDVKLSIEDGTLTIRGEKRQEAEENTERVHRYERSYGSFERTFSLPNSVDPDGIEARYENGLLTVRLPKSERAKPRQIEVKVG
jgi:HSP20 family protein